MKLKEKPKARKKWMRPRHRIITAIAKWILGPYTRMKFHVDIQPFPEQGDRPYLVLMNHQTTFDQFFVSLTFNRPVYYIATEDLFSNGWISRLLKFAVAPIPIRKQTTDMNAVLNCVRVAREGATICLAPEGNRTYNGQTVYIKPSIAKLVRMLKLPLAFFRIEDGYGVQPRWSDVVRKGAMRTYVSRVVEPDDYVKLSEAELMELIEKELWVDEANVSGTFCHSKTAEYLERAIYVCPHCGLSKFESHGRVIECQTCHRQVRYTDTKELEGVDEPFPFRFVANWYDHQCDFVNSLDLTAMTGEPLFCDSAALSEVILNDRKVPMRKSCDIRLYGDRIEIDSDLVFPFADTSAVTVLGRNKLNIYHGKKVYQLKGSKRFNALKYVNLFHRYTNITKGDPNDQFLGL